MTVLLTPIPHTVAGVAFMSVVFDSIGAWGLVLVVGAGLATAAAGAWSPWR